MSIFDFFRGKKKKPAEPKRVDQLEPKKTMHCFVLCPFEHPLDLSRASDIVEEIFGPEYSASVGNDEGNEHLVSVSHNGEAIGFLAHMPAPIPEQEAEHNAAGNFLWVDGEQEAAAHLSHVIVVNAGSAEQTPVQSALLVTRLALVALRVFDGIGVYWGNACVSNSREAFEEFTENLSEEHLPIPMWLRFQLTKSKNERLGLSTMGMEQFGLMDIEVDQTEKTPGDLFEFVANIAHYLVQSGPVIADGNTVGESEEERIVVRHRPSAIDPDRMVYKILFEGD